jgi:hypothetical protein
VIDLETPVIKEITYVFGRTVDWLPGAFLPQLAQEAGRGGKGGLMLIP